ncbi:integral membrane protein DGCR2/IDD-like [Glandiceps talaboti]
MYDITRRLLLAVVFVLTGSRFVISGVALTQSGPLTSDSPNGIGNDSHGPPAEEQLDTLNDIEQHSDTYKGECPDEWQIYEEGRSCYHNFEKKLTYRDAQEQCSTLGGFLATVATDEELQFIVTNNWEQSSISDEQYSWWMGYFYVKKNDTAQWEVAEEQFVERDLEHDEEVFQYVPRYGRLASEEDLQLCGQLVFNVNYAKNEDPYQWYVQRCDTKSAFLCKRAISCVDHKGNKVQDGKKFTPQGQDVCTTCTCYRGETIMCSAAMCAQPTCIPFIEDPDKCCSRTCVDNEFHQEELFDFSDSMRWVLTSATSFLILGLLLFMVHRLRQRRMALIHYTSRSGFRQRSGGLRLNAGSVTSPTAQLDDIDAGIYREPPPPYCLYKLPSPGEEPPPPYDTALLLDNSSAPSTPLSTTDQNAALLETASSIDQQSPTTDPAESTSSPDRQEETSERQNEDSAEERENIPMLPCEQDRPNPTEDRVSMA